MIVDYELIKRLERKLLIGPYEHPYGIEPEGLITEMRVERERYLRENKLPFPSCVDRIADAEIEARKRWPYLFV